MAILLAGIFIAFCLFYYLNQQREIRKAQLRERNKEKFEHLLETLKVGNRDTDVQVSDTTEDDSSNVDR
jgi:hypothetical protein